MDWDRFSARVTSGEMCVSVMLLQHVDGINVRSLGVAEASLFPSEPGTWYTNRVKVEGKKGEGVGSYVLDVLKATLKRRPDFKSLIVEPGGYDNDTERQVRFYTKNGFVRDPKLGDNGYRWTP